ncbi:MAG: S41 family peptidase, partial [Dongiaceae bacterium]
MRYSRLAVLASAFLVAYGLPAASQNTNNSDTYEQLRLFGDVFEKVRADYVEETTDQQLIENAINGML